MANYYATARSNYFAVKDPPAFENWCREHNLNFWTQDSASQLYAIVPDDGDASGWPNTKWNEAKDEWEEFDFFKELSAHLDFDYVAVLEEAGAEARRYISAYAVAVNAKGEVSTVRLDDIYEKAKQMGKIVTDAAY